MTPIHHRHQVKLSKDTKKFRPGEILVGPVETEFQGRLGFRKIDSEAWMTDLRQQDAPTVCVS